MNETIVTLVCVAALGIPYFGCSILRIGGCKLEKFVMFILYVISMVTGVYIFFGAFKVAEPSSQNAVWGGVTGFILMLYSLEKIYAEFKLLFVSAVEPQEGSKGN